MQKTGKNLEILDFIRKLKIIIDDEHVLSASGISFPLYSSQSPCFV